MLLVYPNPSVSHKLLQTLVILPSFLKVNNFLPPAYAVRRDVKFSLCTPFVGGEVPTFPGLDRGVPTFPGLDRGVPTFPGLEWGGVPTFPGLDRGVPTFPGLDGGTYLLDGGYLPSQVWLGRVPTLDGGVPTLSRHPSRQGRYPPA